MGISNGSSDVCTSDLTAPAGACAWSPTCHQRNSGAQLMRHARAYGFAGLAALAVAAAAFAQTTVTPLPEAEPVETAPLTEASAVDALDRKSTRLNSSH